MKKILSYLALASIVLCGCSKQNEMAEELFLALEGLEEQFTMVYNSTVNNAEDQALYGENPAYQDLCENVSNILSAVQQTISIKKTWIEESKAKHMLKSEFEEIYASFEPDIQIPLTQALNLYNDGVAELSQPSADSIYAELANALEGYQIQWTMVYNATVNNEDHYNAAQAAGKLSEWQEICDPASAGLSAVQQTMSTKAAWIEESYNAGTLLEDYEEIYATFEPDIQIPLTQILNAYNDAYATLFAE